MMKIIKLLMATLLISVSLSANAWNIICGISIDAFDKANMPTKWEADGAAIMAMSKFYGAISYLQKINIEAIGNGKDSEIKKIESAKSLFKESNKQLDLADFSALQLIPSGQGQPSDRFGKKSMELWSKLKELNSSFIASLDAGHLPSLSDLHEAINVTLEMSRVGMEASMEHLSKKKLQHTEGGPSVTFK